MGDLRAIAGEYAALQEALDRRPSTGSGGGSPVGAAVIVGGGMKLARLYVSDPLPFYLLGAGIAVAVIAVLALAVKGARK